MLYIAFVHNKPGTSVGNPDIVKKSKKWWNDGDKPEGIKTVAFYGALGTNTPDVYVFECSNHDDIRTMIDYWKEVEFELHPALDMAEQFRRQGMEVT